MNSTAAIPRFVALVAVDGSEASHHVVRVGANLARSAPGAELHLVGVVEDLPPPVSIAPRPMGLGVTTAEILEVARKRIEASSSEARELFAGRIVVHVVAGSAWKQILQTAMDLQADVIVVGTHGRTGARRVAFGSVAEMVVRKASCPVVIAREKDYHGMVPPEIEPPCGDCLKTQQDTSGARFWCERHSQHHPRAHVYYELPDGFGAGSQLLRP